jgi:DHA2 family multidrug resistance protein
VTTGLWYSTNFYLSASFWVLATGRILQGLGMAFLFLPINSLAFREAPKDKTNFASALINLARNFGGSIGISVASTIITRREQFHQTRIVEHLQPLDPTFATLTSQISHAATVTMSGLEPLGRVFQLATAQIMVLIYIDAFKFFSVVFFLLLPLLLFVKPGAASGGGGAA